MPNEASWAVKYRPRETADLIGQDAAKRTLNGAFRDRDQAPPTILLTGPWGTGKTTLARIVAKRFVCEAGATSEGHVIACNACGRCKEVDDGRYPDVIEVDAATHTGVDEMRSLLSKGEQLPAAGKARVIILDEAHMLSVAASNAMLKRLEEPQPHLRFILATTEGDGILPTIRSRCTTLQLGPLATDELAKHLQSISEQEQSPINGETAHEIARLSQGGGRDAITLLQSLSNEAERTPETVRRLINMPPKQGISRLWEALEKADGKAAETTVEELLADGYGAERIWLTMAGEMPEKRLRETPEIGQLIIERTEAMMKSRVSGQIARLLCHEIAGVIREQQIAGPEGQEKSAIERIEREPTNDG